MKTTVVFHSADFDGLFCREIARKFLPDAELIGWDYKDNKIPFPDGMVYLLDLGPDCFSDFMTAPEAHKRLIWIDHHKSSLEKYAIQHEHGLGYRIDGVAACRLTWHWFANVGPDNPIYDAVLANKQDFIDRKVTEPLSVLLAGEYDIWDKRDHNAELFQFGLRSVEPGADFFEALLRADSVGDKAVDYLLEKGKPLQRYQQKNDAGMMGRSFLVNFEGLRFMALNTARCNSLTFMSRDLPETGHDALMGFYFDGVKWNVSLYHAKHRTDLDLSKIAVKFGGGGHRGACGFQAKTLSWLKYEPDPV